MTLAADAVYDSLRRQRIGKLLRPADPGYKDARTVWNGMVARNPGLIVRCATVEEVQAAVIGGKEPQAAMDDVVRRVQPLVH